ncbi:hypothetical protein CPSG_03115 [Coccidioides posadasii str. Silveira]|uniref:Uncharacterized protein n=1 Tax=Coccidioides posadasii (strain RMSCC 757 / Silveira) TaxID=443226 RepID=E9D0T6_COCPS|nr:hypothetical protein CPSG_03115 [Coccidioides posadasii str. Silveira]
MSSETTGLASTRAGPHPKPRRDWPAQGSIDRVSRGGSAPCPHRRFCTATMTAMLSLPPRTLTATKTPPVEGWELHDTFTEETVRPTQACPLRTERVLFQ